MKKFCLIFVISLISGLVFGQSNNIQEALKTIKDRGEVYFKFDSKNIISSTILDLNSIISIDKVLSKEVFAYANAREFDKFLKYGIDIEVLTPPSMVHKSILDNSTKSREIGSWDYYPNWSEYNTIMNQFVTSFPNLCELVTIGTSTLGKELLCIHINNDLTSEQPEPEFLYTSSMHGDELTGYVLSLRLIDYLLENYGTDPDVTLMVDNIDIWINPLANPDGTFAGGDNSVWGATRGNSNFIDLNRNYPDPEDGQHPDGNAWQAETIDFMDFAAEMDFVMSSNFHGGAEVVNYPWDTWSTLAADNDWWVFVSREYADLVHENGWPGYFTDLNNGITNGYAWYSIDGGRQDYMNYFHNCREMTLELSNAKTPPESQLNNYWDANYKSLLAYLNQVRNGLSGTVTNALTGVGVPAMVWIDGHDMDNSEIYANLPFGNYNRLLKQGNYNVTFSALGYYDQTINVSIIDDQSLTLDVFMIPVGTLISNFEASTNITGTNTLVDFYDLSTGNDIITWEWIFEGSVQGVSSLTNPTGIEYLDVGEFDVSLTITDDFGNADTKIIEDYIIVKESIIISDTTVSTCDAIFYDSGFENGNYSNDENFTITFYPDVPGTYVMLDFMEFKLENSWNCAKDHIRIYDGIDTTTSELGIWCGDIGPGIQTASNEQGALTVYYYSDSNLNESGWKAIVSCDSNVGINNFKEVEFKIFPNPASSFLNIQSNEIIHYVTLSDISGRTLKRYYLDIDKSEINISDVENGIYIISCATDSNILTKKLIVR
ncbi:MAG: T9SS type A sorting domain-containing protein [Lentimicrobiaceae bacterium]|jgi:hypothetical protein|nr:T9SS type A sorting domain-containing protein [Lentimicrobiaceae bacterium]MBT3454589.1 T9SS type A sorting domain-containing protein [Lentimicrobiaceae bacterium]MBT3818287.1 T9SS type A sorting domain-containing protein [Lentimicrobiaceae bacterium]MBT4062232.1 T9SS type A sorting domain-containing protein [Lentimicrobiaceae bacterium]MBT4190059.1 T9SS type A sorting domain-containing protein [Lentimicrobiaceae bacterium]